MSTRLLHGDSRELLKTLPDNSVDAVLTDPPYGLTSVTKRFGKKDAKPAGDVGDGRYSRISRGFMGLSWDGSGIQNNPEFWAEVLRVMKPGAHLLSFGGTRTYHRMVCAIEDAGFEIRDMLAWIYGTGAPKSHDASKAIDKKKGAKREVVGSRKLTGKARVLKGGNFNGGYEGQELQETYELTAPATEEAAQWDGWGSALKPAVENIVVAVKPSDDEWELDTINANLSQLEARLWLLLPARTAEESFGLSQVDYEKACGSAQWTVEERHSIQVGLCGRMDMSQCVRVLTSCLSIVQSWRRIWEELCKLTNTFTTETGSSLTTDLRTLRYSLSMTTVDCIIKAVMQVDGQSVSALPAELVFSALVSKLNAIHALSVLESATSPVLTSYQAETDTSLIVLARKPLDGTIAENLLKWGVGCLNIDACRISGETIRTVQGQSEMQQAGLMYSGRDQRDKREFVNTKGRWPANLILDEEAAAILDGQSGEKQTRHRMAVPTSSKPFDDGKGWNQHSMVSGKQNAPKTYESSGGASRFFYVPKPDRSERESGCDRLPQQRVHHRGHGNEEQDDVTKRYITSARNVHPTIKPVNLARYLWKMILPPGGVGLDPFLGSGSIGMGAVVEGYDFIGMELLPEKDDDPPYFEIAQVRIAWAEGNVGLFENLQDAEERVELQTNLLGLLDG